MSFTHFLISSVVGPYSMPITILMRLPTFLLLQFLTGSLASFEFGTKIRALSKLLTVVFLNPISTTVPSMSPQTIQSPCENELSKSIITEAKKFAMMSLAAKATARPPIPSEAISAEISKPSF